MWVLVRGGLGNQMFQVAHAIALSNKYGVIPQFVDTSQQAKVARRWELGCFGLHASDVSLAHAACFTGLQIFKQKLQKTGIRIMPHILVESAWDKADASESPPWLVGGYWQSYKWFQASKQQIIDTFKFPHLGEKVREVEVDRKDEALPKVAIHVRRGDYISDPHTNAIHAVCDLTYFHKAMDVMQQRLGTCAFYVFSDEPEWARENLRTNNSEIFFPATVANCPAWVDMARMAECEHFIISNSSYSWWGAYLGKAENKTVIAPKFWFRGVKTASLDLCPLDWILL
jgi:hypothetical protein